MIGNPVSPSPAGGDVEQGEGLAGLELSYDVLAWFGVQGSHVGAAMADRGLGIMGSEQFACQRDVGKVAATGVESGIEFGGGTAQGESLSAGGGFPFPWLSGGLARPARYYVRNFQGIPVPCWSAR